MDNIHQELSFLSSLVKGLASHFGEHCEVVLLDLSNFAERGSVIVAIENGHVTGRRVGDSGTNLGLEVLRGTDQEGDKYNYITQTKSGRILRSTTIYIRNSNGLPIGCMCVNLDITDLLMAESTIQAFAQFDDSKKDVREIFVNDVNDLMDSLIQDAQHLVGKPVAMMSKEDKVKAIRYLDKKGLFLIKKSGDKVCTYFDISKYTLYSYMEESREDDRNKVAERDSHFQ